MQSSVGIRERIDHVYPRAVAQYIRNHIEEAADLTVGQMADIAHVSQPTVIRFARKLGFGGYRELRYVLRNPAAEHKVTFNPLAGFDLNPWDGEDEIPGKAADGAKALIDELHSALDPKAYRKAVALLAESEFIDIFGVENSLTPAMDLFTKLGYLQQIGAGHLPHGAVAVAFSHSGSSADTVKALRLAKSHGAKTIAITNAIGAPLASWADVTLLTGRDSHTIYGNAIFSRVADTALVDMLYMGVILSGYGRFSTALDESGRMIHDRVFEN